MQDCKLILTPLLVNLKLSSEVYPSTEAERIEVSRVPHALVVGLMFPMICKSQIAQTAGAVSQLMANPGKVLECSKIWRDIK